MRLREIQRKAPLNRLTKYEKNSRKSLDYFEVNRTKFDPDIDIGYEKCWKMFNFQLYEKKEKFFDNNPDFHEYIKQESNKEKFYLHRRSFSQIHDNKIDKKNAIPPTFRKLYYSEYIKYVLNAIILFNTHSKWMYLTKNNLKILDLIIREIFCQQQVDFTKKKSKKIKNARLKTKDIKIKKSIKIRNAICKIYNRIRESKNNIKIKRNKSK